MDNVRRGSVVALAVAKTNMPKPKGVSSESAAILEALEGYITELHSEWKTLLELFATGGETSKLLNDTAGALFDTLYRVLIRDILLGVARLTDPLKTAGKDNLVLERVAQLPEVVADTELTAAAAEALADIKSLAQPFRDYRNKYLAHLDLPTSLAPSGDVLPGIKRDDVEAILAAFAKLFNRIDGPLRDRYVLFKNVAIIGGPKNLIKAFEDSRVWRSVPRSERMRILGTRRLTPVSGLLRQAERNVAIKRPLVERPTKDVPSLA